MRFRSPSSAAHALREVLELGGRVLQVRRFRPGKERPTEREVFVESLSWHTKEDGPSMDGLVPKAQKPGAVLISVSV